MVDNVIVKCKYCATVIRMRFQMGYFDIPFNFCCPECGVHIHGLRKIVNESTFELNNAEKTSGKIEDADYYIDLSVELPHKKITKYESLEKLMESGFSPFMNTLLLYDSEEYINLMKKMARLLQFRQHGWQQLLPLYDLFFNKKIYLMEKHFASMSSRFVVKNELDALMALHQTTVIGMNSILGETTLDEYKELSRKITLPSMLPKINDFIIDLGGKDYFDSVFKRLIKIYSRWMTDFEKYIPATMLSLGGATDKFDKDTYGIATASFEDMKSFYADSYELILDYVDVAIGLNNIAERGDHNSFPDNSIKVDKKKNRVDTFEDYKAIIKSSRLQLLVDDEPFSKAIPLNRNVRNAIAHFNYDFEASSQKIIFSDKHKNKSNNVELYLIDLALLCYENMTILVYMDELMYTLRKFDYMKDGMCPHIKSPK